MTLSAKGFTFRISSVLFGLKVLRIEYTKTGYGGQENSINQWTMDQFQWNNSGDSTRPSVPAACRFEKPALPAGE
jgi:hypothetical protein